MIQKLDGHQLFDGRTIVIATMHHKEKVIAPHFEKEFGAKCRTIPDLDTDQFGTFSGEIKRVNSPIETLRYKALAALDFCDETLVIASEGSFGSHPSSPFIPANEEMVILIDTKNQLEIVGRHFTVNTNFNHREIKSLKDLIEFKSQIGYPEHGIVLKTNHANNKNSILKDFKTSSELDAQVQLDLESGYHIVAETDMRAKHNPTRMCAIEKAVIDLIKNIKSLCPECKTPGFVICEVILGLPCELCHCPTKSAKTYVYKCQKCHHELGQPNKDKSFEDPTYCDFCNP